MKKIILILVLIIPLISFGQYEGILFESFFGRQPSARAEALGRGYSSIDGDLATIFYNPAGTATMQGIEINTSIASPYYLLEEAEYSFTSIGYSVNKYLTIGVSRNRYSQNRAHIRYPVLILYSPHLTTIYSLNISSQPIKNLFIGINANYITMKYNDKLSNTLYFDVGIIKKFQFGKKESVNHSINIGVSVTNLNSAKIPDVTLNQAYDKNLPIINRYGINYQFYLNKKWILESLTTFRLLVQGDYQLLLNSEDYIEYHTGAELMFLEILSLRIGYYIENKSLYDFYLPQYSETRSFTYGFDLNVPMYKLTKIPLNISLDFTSLPQISYSKKNRKLDNFTNTTLRLNWIII